ncbi:MAG: transcription antitermination factor NusB [Oscillospiraceae bacterium]|nr:transcription antitermination factor NusB [Oscillospiraceae bacterium]MBO7728667.1 transcription antitermination factor NusB [Oscillospiraceae bacterium]
MTRDTAREIAIQIVFGASHSEEDPSVFLERFFSEEHFCTLSEENELFTELPEGSFLEYIRSVVGSVFEHLDEIDASIQKYSRSWSVKRISGTALAVLRVAIAEILYREDVSLATAINSAVEIDKKYDDAETVAFVNGVLGGFVRGENLA